MREEWNILPSAFLPAGQNDESVSSNCSKIIKRELNKTKWKEENNCSERRSRQPDPA